MPANPYQNVNVYGKNQRAHAEATVDGNSRNTDAQALLVCAAKLNDGKARLAENNTKDNMRIYNDAIRTNQRLWTIFQVALSDAQNPLPQQLKITLLNLSRYVDKTSFKAIGKYRPDLIDSLVNINRILAAGLSKQTQANAAPAPVDRREIPISLTTSA